MLKKSLVIIAAITGMAMTACLLGDDIESLERRVTEDNIGRLISDTFIEEVTRPMCGKAPVTSFVNGDNHQYTGTVTWEPADATFKLGVQYTATINLTAEPGYTLHMARKDDFKVAGATSTNSANSGGIPDIGRNPVGSRLTDG